MSIEHILLDMDGVLVSWDGAVKRLFDKEHVSIDSWDTETYLGVTADEMWEKIDAQGEAFWRYDVQPYPWFDQLLSLVRGWPWTLASTPSKDPNSAYGKRLWIADRFGPDFVDYMLGKRKQLMAKPGVVLIDDSDKNVREFRAHGGSAILFPQPWNSNRGLLTGDRIDYVRSQLNAIRDGEKSCHGGTRATCQRVS